MQILQEDRVGIIIRDDPSQAKFVKIGPPQRHRSRGCFGPLFPFARVTVAFLFYISRRQCFIFSTAITRLNLLYAPRPHWATGSCCPSTQINALCQAASASRHGKGIWSAIPACIAEASFWLCPSCSTRYVTSGMGPR